MTAASPANPANVRCKACGEELPAQFEQCWKCGASRGGDADPAFVPAVTLRVATHCAACGYALEGTAATGRCPECGTPFAREHFDTAGPPAVQPAGPLVDARLAVEPGQPRLVTAGYGIVLVLWSIVVTDIITDGYLNKRVLAAAAFLITVAVCLWEGYQRRKRLRQVRHLVTELYSAWGLHEPDRIDAIFTDDGVYQDVAGGGVYRGKGEIKALVLLTGTLGLGTLGVFLYKLVRLWREWRGQNALLNLKCPRCGFDVRGQLRTMAVQCPECGELLSLSRWHHS